MCHCRHSFGAHYLSSNGVCGFCFCQALQGDVMDYRARLARMQPRSATPWHMDELGSQPREALLAERPAAIMTISAFARAIIKRC